MSDHSIDDLRKRLFETIDGVKAGTINLDQARTISELSQVVVNTAKVEVEFLRATDGNESKFLAGAKKEPQLPTGITGTTVHRIKG